MIAIYVRVSTEEQATRGYSIDGQIEECLKKANTTDVLKYIDDGYSGELLERPAINKLRHDVREGLINKVICYDPDRLARKLMFQLVIDDELKKNGVQLVFVNGEYANTPEGQLFFSMRGAISEFEKAKIKERTSSGRKMKAKKGKVVKDSKLYGYTFDKEKSTYVVNEEEAKIVRMIFNYYTDPSSPFKGINGIAHHLTSMGIATKKGGKTWHRQVVRQILMNRSYTGIYIQNRYDTDGMYILRKSGNVAPLKFRPEDEWITLNIPSIISEEQFEYAQELISLGRRRYANYGQHDYLLSGLVRCGRCGSTMTGKKTKSHGKDFYVYECRKNYAGAANKGCGRLMSENKLNNYVWSALVKLFNNPEEIMNFEDNNQKPYIYEEMQHLLGEIDKTKKGRQRLITLISLSEDDLDLDELKDKIRELQQKEKNLQNQYNVLEEEIKQDSKNVKNENILKQAIERYFQYNGENLTREQKKDLVRMVIKEIVIIDKDNVNINTF